MIHFYFSMRKRAWSILIHFASKHGRAAYLSHIYQSIMFHLYLRLPTIAQNLVILTFSSVITEVTKSWKPPDRLEAQIPAGVQIFEMDSIPTFPQLEDVTFGILENSSCQPFGGFTWMVNCCHFSLSKTKRRLRPLWVKSNWGTSQSNTAKKCGFIFWTLQRFYFCLGIALISLRFFYTKKLLKPWHPEFLGIFQLSQNQAFTKKQHRNLYTTICVKNNPPLRAECSLSCPKHPETKLSLHKHPPTPGVDRGCWHHSYESSLLFSSAARSSRICSTDEVTWICIKCLEKRSKHIIPNGGVVHGDSQWYKVNKNKQTP